MVGANCPFTPTKPMTLCGQFIVHKYEKSVILLVFRSLIRTFAAVKNMLSIIRLSFKAVRPSRIADMPAVSNALLLRRNYEALTFFGFILTHTQQEADHFNSHYDELKNHEMIHLRQARDTGDSWLCFYLLYFWYWLKGLRWNRRLKNAAYWMNPFEMEAYHHDHDLGYAERCSEGAKEWRKYAKMTFEERRAACKTIYRR